MSEKNAIPREEIGLRRFLVHDHYDNCHEQFDSLPEAIEHAETLVEQYQDDAADGGWTNDGPIDVCMVIQRWSVVPIDKPADADPDMGDSWADMLPVEIPGACPLTLDEIDAIIKERLMNDKVYVAAQMLDTQGFNTYYGIMQAIKEAAIAKARGIPSTTPTTKEG